MHENDIYSPRKLIECRQLFSMAMVTDWKCALTKNTVFFILINYNLYLNSYEIIALQKKIVDRPESYAMNRAKSCVFRAHENLWAVLHLIPHFLTQSAPKNG
jgi:hypothetical protein